MKIKKILDLEINSLSAQIQNKNLNDDEVLTTCLELVKFLELKEVLS